MNGTNLSTDRAAPRTELTFKRHHKNRFLFRYSHSRLMLGLSVLITMAVYWPGLYGMFFFDDGVNFLLNDAVQITKLDIGSMLEAARSGVAGPLGRPISQATFALNYYFSGFDPFFFKLTNLLIHTTNGILVYLITKRLLTSIDSQKSQATIALTAAALSSLWMLHPVQLTTVLYVVQRMTSIYSLFLLLALLLHISARQHSLIRIRESFSLFLAWCIFFPLALFSKETAVVFLGFILAYEWTVRFKQHGTIDRFGWILTSLILLVTIAGIAYALSPVGDMLRGYDGRSFNLMERLLTQARVLWLYMSLMFIPRLDAFALHHDYIIVSTSLWFPRTTFLSLVGLAGLLALAFGFRRSQPLAALGILWFLAAHGLESTFLPLEIAHEHRNYLALFGVLLVVVAFFDKLAATSRASKVAIISIVCAMIVYSALVTGLRAHQFGDEVRRTQVSAMHQPSSARAHYEAGLALAHVVASRPEDIIAYAVAKEHYQRATDIDPTLRIGLLGLIHLGCIQHGGVDRDSFDELRHRLSGQPPNQTDPLMMRNLVLMSAEGTLCMPAVDINRLFSAALSSAAAFDTRRAVLYRLWGDYYVFVLRELGSATSLLSKARELSPEDPEIGLNLAQLLFLEGRYGETLSVIDEISGQKLSPSERLLANRLRECAKSDGARCELLGRNPGTNTGTPTFLERPAPPR